MYGPLEMPDVEVLVDGVWCPGEARMRTELPGGTFRYLVAYRRELGGSSSIDDFEGDRIRLDTVDRSRGRGLA